MYKQLTATQIINERKNEIINEVQDIEAEIRAMQERMESLAMKRDRRLFEYDLLDKFDSRNDTRFTHIDAEDASARRMSRSSRVSIEDCIKEIFDNAGRPIKIGKLIEELEKYNYQWSTPASAYQYLTKIHILDKVPQTHGYYQLHRF